MQYHKVPIGGHFIALKVFLGGDAILPAVLGALLFFIIKANCIFTGTSCCQVRQRRGENVSHCDGANFLVAFNNYHFFMLSFCIAYKKGAKETNHTFLIEFARNSLLPNPPSQSCIRNSCRGAPFQLGFSNQIRKRLKLSAARLPEWLD